MNVSIIRAELRELAQKAVAAEKALWAATERQDTLERDAAQQEQDDALGDHYAVSRDVAELGLMLLRYALDHNAGAVITLLRETVREIVGPDLTEMANAIANLERNRR